MSVLDAWEEQLAAGGECEGVTKRGRLSAHLPLCRPEQETVAWDELPHYASNLMLPYPAAEDEAQEEEDASSLQDLPHFSSLQRGSNGHKPHSYASFRPLVEQSKEIRLLPDQEVDAGDFYDVAYFRGQGSKAAWYASDVSGEDYGDYSDYRQDKEEEEDDEQGSWADPRDDVRAGKARDPKP